MSYTSTVPEKISGTSRVRFRQRWLEIRRILHRSGKSYTFEQVGAGDIPIVGHFNGDVITNQAVFRNGEWIIDHNMDGLVNDRVRFSQNGDIPPGWNG